MISFQHNINESKKIIVARAIEIEKKIYVDYGDYPAKNQPDATVKIQKYP